jgi:XTP/dITP diphosphohydrolase
LPLLVVPLGADEAGDLTLAEWDALRACDLVMFEQPAHPLVERLREAGVKAVPFDDEPAATDDGRALVADPGSPRIIELARAGAVVTSGVAETPDSLTAAHGAYVGRRAAKQLGSLALIMARLRGPDGCPWDAEQTHSTLETHLLEEANEVLQAIDDGQVGAELEEELGDLLLQVVFHSQLAADDSRFDVAGVGEGIITKLIRRHPHVFGDTEVADAGEVLRNWQTIKKSEPKKREPFGERDLERALDRLLALARRKGVEPNAALARSLERFPEIGPAS